jgi:hypothetical protein
LQARAPVVGDLLKINQHAEIECHWHACRRQVRWSALQAVQRLGLDTTWPQAAKRLRCHACGALGRERQVSIRPCTLDLSAWNVRQKYDALAAAGDALAAAHLADELFTLTKLLGGRGDLGGDGPRARPEPAVTASGALGRLIFTPCKSQCAAQMVGG